MNRFFILIMGIGVLSCAILSGCAKKENPVDVEKLISERDSLLQISQQQNENINNINSFFTEISDCLDSIAEQEQILLISTNPETNIKYSSSELRERLRLLSGIMTRQRQRIQNLSDSLSHTKDSNDYKKLSKMIDYLSQQLEAKEARIKSLVEEVNNKNKDIARLSSDINNLKSEVSDVNKKNEMLSTAVIEQTKMLNQGYLLIGDKKKLQEIGVLTKGNLLKKAKFNPGNLDLNSSEIIDISKVREIPLNSKKPKILSPVPSGSYQIVDAQEGGKKLIISQPSDFWSLSNILVIQL